MTSDERQVYVSRIAGLEKVSETVLKALAVLYGEAARSELDNLRQSLLDEFRNSDILPEREMDHAQVVGPALEAIEKVFEVAMRDIRD